MDQKLSLPGSASFKTKVSFPFIHQMHKVTKPIFFIGGHNGGVIVNSILIRHGWKRTDEKFDEECLLRWTEQLMQINVNRLKQNISLINHIPNCESFTNKIGLLRSLRDYERSNKVLQRHSQYKISDFVPQTYIIDDIKERQEFFRKYKDNDIWINKPAGSNQGKGITLIRDLEKFKFELSERDYMMKSLAWGFNMNIIQKYISNPLLINGRKFDIRCFMLIASTIPYLVLFHPGYIRLSINKYSNSDDCLITHLTNQFIQKQSPKYSNLKDTTISTIEDFNIFFNSFYKHLKNFKYNWVKTDLMDHLKSIMLHVFKSVKHKLVNNISYFELYGLDFVVDDNLKVWLIEANKNPSMSVSCSILEELIPTILEETLLIAFECFEKNTKTCTDLLPLSSIKYFQIIFSENLNLSRSRRSYTSGLRTWNSPRYRVDDFKSFSESTLPVNNTVPDYPKTFQSYRTNLRETIEQRRKRNFEDPKMSTSDLRNLTRDAYQKNLSKRNNFRTFSGDMRFENIISRDDLLLNYSPTSSLLNIKLVNLIKSQLESNRRYGTKSPNRLPEALKNI